MQKIFSTRISDFVLLHFLVSNPFWTLNRLNSAKPNRNKKNIDAHLYTMNGLKENHKEKKKKKIKEI